MTLVYCPEVNDSLAFPDQDESRHLIQVLRKRKGDTVGVTDGKGSGWLAVLEETGRNRVVLRLTDTVPPPMHWGFDLHMAVAPPKQGARLDWMLEKLTETGVDRITLLRCARSERTHWRFDRLQRLLVSAMKQSLQFRLPILDPVERPMEDFLAEPVLPTALKLLPTCDWGNLPSLSSVYKRAPATVVLIGPEGDFSPQEVDAARTIGYLPVLLGNNRLRTETAGLVACAQIHTLHEAVS